MAKFLFYTDEGYSIAPNEEVVENLQILGIEEGINEKEAFGNLFQNNEWIIEMGFSKEKIKCQAIFNTSIINDLKVVSEYLLEDEQKHFEESKFNKEDNDSHIFNSLVNIKSIL